MQLLLVSIIKRQGVITWLIDQGQRQWCRAALCFNLFDSKQMENKSGSECATLNLNYSKMKIYWNGGGFVIRGRGQLHADS